MMRFISLQSHKLPLPQGEGWGEGIKIDNPLFYLSPHPVLLPKGEGITPNYRVA